MKPSRRSLLLVIAAIALILLLATCGMWVRSRVTSRPIKFVSSARSYEIQSDSHGMSLRATGLNSTMTATVTGMTPTPNGWIESPGQPVTLRVENLQGSDQAPLVEIPLSIIRTGFRAQGFAWLTGFTAPRAMMGRPFPACQVDQFTLSYTEAVVLSSLVMLIAGYFGLRRGQSAEGRCPRCGSYLSAATGQCPACGTTAETTV